MEPWLRILIWVLVGTLGLFSFVVVAVSKNKYILKFIIWFVSTIMVSMILMNILGNDFVVSFIFAIVLSWMAVKDD